MSPVSWATTAAPLTETVIAVMICRENPSAVHIRPSQGDGGIDVLQLTPRGWIVDQIKYFAINLDDSQKRQIVSSLERVRTYAEERGAEIAEWRLVTPLDPTKENRLDWFDTITADAGFPCEWRGLSYVEGLAAKYPEVVDYYLRDGRERVEQRISQVAVLCRLFNQTDTVIQRGALEPADTVAGLRAVYKALNNDDPHYRYGFAVDPTMPDVPPEPDQVAVVQLETESGCVTFKVFTRYDAAVLDRPIGGAFNMAVPPDSDAARMIADHQAYGSPLILTADDGAILTVTADLPAGLGTLFPEHATRISITPLWSQPLPARMQVLDADGRDLQTVRLNLQPAAYNADRSGMFITGTEQHGIFDIDMKISLATNTVDTTLTYKDSTGKAPADVLPALRLLSAFRHPHQFRLAPTHGPLLGEADAIPADRTPQPALIGLTALVDALCTIQEHTTDQVSIPDFETYDGSAARELLELADLLRNGRRESRWTMLSTTRSTAPQLAGEDSALLIDQDLAYNINGRTIRLGKLRQILKTVRLESAEPDDDGNVQVRLVPGTSAAMTEIHIPGSP